MTVEFLPHLQPACPQLCSACPWRTSNHGKSHPGHWYTKGNRDRLWAVLRRGESMSCHPTDPANPLPPGFDPLPEGVTTHECAGALILQQRELVVFEALDAKMKGRPSREVFAAYRGARPSRMTTDGLRVMMLRKAITQGSEFLIGRVPMTQGLDLNLDVSHVLPWEKR